MLLVCDSMDDAMNLEELDALAFQTDDSWRIATVAYTCELKIDGLGVALTYRDGQFVRAATKATVAQEKTLQQTF